jgi:murein DD-endopeptidase MepM/ murein hydrolase activator NlpD
MAKLAEDVTVLFGNFVVIRHAEGVFSLSAHLKQGSVVVKAGDRVRAGQKIGQVGASGGVSLPHLHFQLQECATARCEGLPVEFERFRRLRGARSIAVRRGPIDTGEIVQRD